ncbi:MAG TPA: cupin domain-containing protein [Vicinamibacteria bacterium]|nr:cupin domain-containing protein [Vicinamibacteria bacterium]
MPPASTVLGALPVDRFLANHWQKEPLVVRGAFPNFKDPLSPDELAGLACEPDVESRLVRERGGRKRWQVTRGPQDPRVLRKLGRSHWTLLVESMDRHSREVAALASAFSFIPRWRMDDVMVSLAPLHGTVDAHIDSYDVFLIQGQGRRRWEVDRRSTPDYKPGLDLRILKRFRAEDSWVLEPGDMLYVPPGVGHRGVTVLGGAEVALTYSVGFRAPSSADLLSTLLSRALASETQRLFSDAGRKASRDAGEISSQDRAALRDFLISDLESSSPDAWALAMGEAVTSGGSTGVPAANTTRRSAERRLAGGSTVSVIPGARMAWARLSRGRAALFVNGEGRVLPRPQAFAAPFLCGNPSRAAARRVAAHEPLLSLLVDLFRAAVVEWSD